MSNYILHLKESSLGIVKIIALFLELSGVFCFFCMASAWKKDIN